MMSSKSRQIDGKKLAASAFMEDSWYIRPDQLPYYEGLLAGFRNSRGETLSLRNLPKTVEEFADYFPERVLSGIRLAELERRRADWSERAERADETDPHLQEGGHALKREILAEQAVWTKLFDALEVGFDRHSVLLGGAIADGLSANHWNYGKAWFRGEVRYGGAVSSFKINRKRGDHDPSDLGSMYWDHTREGTLESMHDLLSEFAKAAARSPETELRYFQR